jgi:hypothetical protein
MSGAPKSTPKEKFLDFLTHKNLRVTSQRQAIVDTVFGTDQHFTAEQLLEWSQRRDKSVSRATVYRTLPRVRLKVGEGGKEFVRIKCTNLATCLIKWGC